MLCSNQLSYPACRQVNLPISELVAGAGVEPASGDYEPPEITISLPRDDMIIYLKINVHQKKKFDD